MSGYLERIASGILHPQRAIHPSVGSLWMPQRNSALSEQPGETVAPIARRYTEPDAQPTRTALTRMSAEQQPASDASNPIEAKLETVLPLVARRDTTTTLRPDGEDADAAPARTGFTPLVATSSRESLAQARALAPTSTPRRESVPRTLPLNPAPASQPEEIEIHIGRIEVAAVLPQPAPRLTGRPVRKSLDLGEYLKRDRRSR